VTEVWGWEELHVEGERRGRIFPLKFFCSSKPFQLLVFIITLSILKQKQKKEYKPTFFKVL
jgi:hypothetical protein